MPILDSRTTITTSNTDGLIRLQLQEGPELVLTPKLARVLADTLVELADVGKPRSSRIWTIDPNGRGYKPRQRCESKNENGRRCRLGPDHNGEVHRWWNRHGGEQWL